MLFAEFFTRNYKWVCRISNTNCPSWLILRHVEPTVRSSTLNDLVLCK